MFWRSVSVSTTATRYFPCRLRLHRPGQADINAEFERLRSEGMNPATAMWKASLVAQKKKNAAVDGSALTTGAQGAFAASAMAMFKDDQEGEGQLGADGVVRTAAPFVFFVSPCVCVHWCVGSILGGMDGWMACTRPTHCLLVLGFTATLLIGNAPKWLCVFRGFSAHFCVIGHWDVVFPGVSMPGGFWGFEQ